MKKYSITDLQHKEQIEQEITIKIIFTKDEKRKKYETWLTLYNQSFINKLNYFIKPTFCIAKKITKEQFNEILGFCSDEEFDDGLRLTVKIMYSTLSYNEFFEKFYNHAKESNELRTL